MSLKTRTKSSDATHHSKISHASAPESLKVASLKAIGGQAQLRMGKPQDPYERQADKVADSVVAGETRLGDKVTFMAPVLSNLQSKVPEDSTIQTSIQQDEKPVQARQLEQEAQAKPVEAQEEELQAQPLEEEGEALQAQAKEKAEEEELQAKPVKNEERVIQLQVEEETMQARAVEGRRSAIDPAGTYRRAKGRVGSPLENRVRDKLERAFNLDFSGVRVHQHDAAVVLNQELGARALTSADDIFFNRGEYQPDSRAGLHLLAHELTHTVQQRKGRHGTAALQPKIDKHTESYQIRPELLEAVANARSQIGTVNAKIMDAEGNRQGWERIRMYFDTAFGGNVPVHPDVIQKIKTYANKPGQVKDMLPHWCGIFVWWSLKTANIPVPDWKLGWSSSKFLVARAKGEIPHKGDIAYRNTNNHFAIVSGVDFSGPGGSARIATINGNTAGQDNLGGQIEEQFDPLNGWDVFYNTLAKLDMPSVPLTTTQIEADEEVKAIQTDTPGPVQTALAIPESTDVVVTEEVAINQQPTAHNEVAVEILEIPPATLIEPAAPISPLVLSGSTSQMVSQAALSSPSQLAADGDKIGSTVSKKLVVEGQVEKQQAPVLDVNLSGKVESGKTAPGQLIPAQAEIADGATDTAAVVVNSPEHQNHGAAPSSQGRVNDMQKKSMLGGFFDWLKSNFNSLINGLPSSDSTLNTSAGQRKRVDMTGSADPNRMAVQRQDASGKLRDKRDEVTGKFVNHPGQDNIQAKSVHRPFKAEMKNTDPEPVETTVSSEASDYAQAALPANVRVKADEKLANLQAVQRDQARLQSEQALAKKHNDEARAINEARARTDALNKMADSEQRQIVIAQRGKVAGKQKQGIEQAYAEVNRFEQTAVDKQNDNNLSLRQRVTSAESSADQKLKAAEDFAYNEKQRGSREATKIRADLKKQEQQDKSWWDHTVDFIKSAVEKASKAIDSLFTRIRKVVADTINAAKDFVVNAINTAREFVVSRLNAFRDWAREQVTRHLGSTFPGLANMINTAIDGLVDIAIAGVNMAADGAIAGVEALAKGLASLLDRILSIYQSALKAAVQIIGAVLTGDFAEALKIAIRAACEIAGIDPEPIFGFFARAGNMLLDILRNPIPFFNNLVKAIGLGVQNFVKNIKRHLVGGLIDWLTGALSNVSITLPQQFDFKGIVSLVLQILGLTYAQIKARIIRRYPKAAKVFAVIEKSVSVIRVLVTEGVAGLWRMIRQHLVNLKEMVMGAIRNFVITTVVKQAVSWLLGLLNPAGALIKVLMLLYDIVMFFVARFNQIKDFILSVYHSIAAIASGTLGAAATAVENAMARSLPVLISFLASLAGLSGISKTVKNIIARVRAPIAKVIDKVVDKVVVMARKLVGKAKRAAKSIKDKITQWWKVNKKFIATNGESHTLLFKGGEQDAKLMVRSKEQPYSDFLNGLDVKSFDAGQQQHLIKAKQLAAQIDIKRKERVDSKDDAEKARNSKAKQDALDSLLVSLSESTKHLFGDALPEWQEPDYGAMNSAGFGTSMNIKVLSKNGDGWKNGSTPSQARHAQYDVLNLRRQKGGASFYIRGHLLNDNLGGPGQWKNMTPLSREGNHQHEAQVESVVKAGFNSKAAQRYKVVPQYTGHGGDSSLKKALADKYPTQATTFNKIIDAEINVPTSLRIEAARIEKQGDSYTDKDKKTWDLKNNIQRNAESYFLSDSPEIIAVNVNGLTSAKPLVDLNHTDITPVAPAITMAVANRRNKGLPSFGTYATLARETVDQGGNLTEATAKKWNQDGYILLK